MPVKTSFIHYSPVHLNWGTVRAEKWNFLRTSDSLFPIQFSRACNIYSQASETVNHRSPLLDCRWERFSRERKTLSHAPLLAGLDSKSLLLQYRTPGQLFPASTDFTVEPDGITVTGTHSIWKKKWAYIFFFSDYLVD